MTDKRKWTDEEAEYLIKNKHLHINELMKHLGRSHQSIHKKCQRLGIKRINDWTEKELKLLQKHYGTMNTKRLCKLINKTKYQVARKIVELEGTQTKEYVSGHLTTNDVQELLGVSKSTIIRWIKNGELPAVRVSDKKLLVKEHVLWNWVKENIEKPNYMKIDDSIEFIAPEWYRQEIKNRKRNFSKNITGKQNRWTRYEEVLATNMRSNGYTRREIAQELGRTYMSVKKKFELMSENKRKQMKA